MATVNGDNGDNFLVGTEDEDVINGFGGNDTIDSVDRPSNIFAGSIAPRRDVVDAGDGNDFVTGGRLDQLNGGAGNDFLLVNFNFNGPVAGSATPITLTLDSTGTGAASDGTRITGFETVSLFLSDTGDNVVDTGDVQAQLSGGGGDDTLTTGAANDFVGGAGGDDVISTGGGDDSITGGGGDDLVAGGDGDDSFGVNLMTDGADEVNLGAGADTVRFDRFDGGMGNIRLTFTSAEVGNGDANDSNTMMNQDGGLAVRVQSEDADGNLTGPVSRYDDEGTTFIAGTQGITFDVRDLVSGAQRGNMFEGVVLGTSGADSLTFFPPFRSGQNFYYNAGMGDDVVTAGEANDFLVGGGGNDRLTGNGGDDSFIGGGGRDRFNYSLAAETGSDTIIDFMKVDLFVSDAALRDGNRDGRIAFGPNSVLDLDGAGGDDTVTFTGLDPASGLRFLGRLEDGGFAYADAATRPMGAIEGMLGDSMLMGRAGEQVFFFDTALGLDFGDDRITGFGSEDLIVTTTAIADGDGDGRIDFGGDRTLDLSDGASVRINDGAVRALEFDGSVTQNGATYFVYSRVGSDAGTDDVFG